MNGENQERNTVSLKRAFDFIDFFGKILGWRFCYEWKRNWKHWIGIGFMTFSWSQFTYTQSKYLMNREPRKVFEVFALYGVLASCTLKARCFIRYYKEVAALHKFSFKITRQAGKHVAEHLDQQQLRNLKLYQFIFWVQVTSVLIYVYYPIKSSIYDRVQVSLLPMQIMFIDQTEPSQFLLANVIMALMSVHAVLISVFVSMHFYATILNYTIQVHLIEVDIRQLDGFWSNTKTTTLSERHSFIRNISQKCQDKDNYIAEIKNVFDQLIYLYFASAYLSQIICLYEVQMENWIPGYGLAYGLFVEMLCYCFFGTKVTIINDQLCYILTQSKWYTYDVYSQKIFLNLLNSCMNCQELWIGPLAPLSVITGIQILKSIYSYYTFLTEVV